MDQQELKGILFKSENDQTTYYFICIAEKKDEYNANVSIYTIDQKFSSNDEYQDKKNGTEASFFAFQLEPSCKLELWGKYFFPTFEDGMQMYYDDKKYYEGKQKTDQIQSLSDAINYAIEYGLKEANIKPY